MQKITVTDTSCLILLYNINELELLRKVYSEIRITKTIFEEFNKPIPELSRSQKQIYMSI